MDTQVDIVTAPWQPAKIKLTIEHVAALIQKNYNQAQIAKLSNVSRQAVDQFVERHYDVLQPLIDNTDTVLAMRLKKQAISIANSIDDDNIKKASLMQKATAAGIMIDKYRLLSGQSTENLAIDTALRGIHASMFQPDVPVSKTIDVTPGKKRAKKR